MLKVVGVRFREGGKISYYLQNNHKVKAGQYVIAETSRGTEYGYVVVADKLIESPEEYVKPIIRVATPEDHKIAEKNKEKEQYAKEVCLEKIREHNLVMKLVDVEYTFDNNKLLFYFTADGRVDFRELVKDLAAIFKTRIELRQIGVRDETKLKGGIGICGRELCCHKYLSDFGSVSIKMAKEQNISLNTSKISGVCGRLMCCLKNEADTYEELNRYLPDVGDIVRTNDGYSGEVYSVNVLRQLVKVIITLENDEKEIKEYNVLDLKFKPKKRSDRYNINDEELKALEALERKEGKSLLNDD